MLIYKDFFMQKRRISHKVSMFRSLIKMKVHPGQKYKYDLHNFKARPMSCQEMLHFILTDHTEQT